MISRPLKAVIFDFDGTLVNSLPFVLKALSHALAPYSDRRLTMDIFPSLGAPPEKFFHDFVRNPADVPAALRRLDEYNATHGIQASLYDGAEAMLRNLYLRGIKLGIWTGRDRNSCTKILHGLGLAEFFSVIVCGDDLPSHKPDPEGMFRILKSLDVERESVLFIGDADVDVQGGLRSGVATILIRHGREVSPEIHRAARRLVETPGEAYQGLVSLNLSGKS